MPFGRTLTETREGDMIGSIDGVYSETLREFAGLLTMRSTRRWTGQAAGSAIRRYAATEPRKNAPG